jgi:amino acid adenylation domain-containing protein
MNIKDIDDIYPLSPLQKAMLPTDAKGLLQRRCGLFNCTLHGVVDVAKFESAWKKVAEQHPLLRTSFAWKHLSEPVQLVRKQASLYFQKEDGPPLSFQQVTNESQAYVRRYLQQGLDPSGSPLLRLMLLQTSDGEYKLVCVYHHLVLDSLSLPLILTEALAFYEDIINELDPQVRVDHSFREYVIRLKSQEWSDARALWQEQFKDFTGATSLGVSRRTSGSETQSDGYDEQSVHGVHVSDYTTASVQRLMREHHLALGVFMQAVWAVLLSRYSSEEEVTFGFTIGGRPDLEGSEYLIGPFKNTLPISLKVPCDMTMLQWLKHIQRLHTSMRRYPHVSVMQVREWTGVPADTPLFSNNIVVDDGRDNRHLSIGRGRLTAQDVETLEDATSPLALTARLDIELALEVRYETHSFDEVTIRQVLYHLRTLIEAAAARPEQCLFEFSLLSDAARRQVLLDWNDTKTLYPQQCIHQLFEHQVEQTPHAVAVGFEGRYLTYDGLNRRSNQLADYLRGIGVGPEVPVAFLVERSIEMIVGLLGILKTGGAYVPLDLASPPSRLALILEEVRSPVVLTQEHLVGRLKSCALRKVIVDPESDFIKQCSDKDPSNLASPNNLAYVTYTSGSTGKPKGIGITHRNVIRLVKGSNYARLTSEQVFLQFAPVSFDASTFEVWGCLLNGARLVLMAANNPGLHELGQALRQHGVTTLWLTAGLFHLMVDERLEDLKQVRQLLAGGDVLSAPHVIKALREARDCHLINGYGPTENTTFTCCYRIDRSEHLNGSVPIGKPISNTRTYLLDRAMQPLAIGIPGELYTGGDGLGRGYINKPDLTADRFMPDPFSTEGQRCYRSGDMARYLPDGNIEFIGRNDEQVKIRGFRIELAEIEAALRDHPSVRASTTIISQEGYEEKTLVAYVVPENNEQPSVDELRLYLNQRLPDYAVPTIIVMIEALPLTSNGKVNKRTLPAPVRLRSDLKGVFESPRTPVEAVIAGIWQETLGIEGVSLRDNFFMLGGHSLLATKVIARVRDRLKAPVNVLSLFERPTVEGLAELVEKAMKAGPLMEAPPIEPVSRAQKLPLSFAQQRLWFLDQLEPGNAFYTIPTAARMRGRLHVAALEAALSAMVRRHESLRTTFVNVDDQAIQMIGAPEQVLVIQTDLRGLAGQDLEPEIRRLIREEARRSFDLAKGPLLRVGLLRLAAEDQIMLLTMHHIVSDEWSMGVFVRELGTLCNEYTEGKASCLEELRIQYADFAFWQREWLKGEVLERQLKYWQQHLADAPPVLDLPTDRPRPPIKSHQGARRSRQLPLGMGKQLSGLANRHGATLFMTTLTAFEVLLTRYTGREDILIGTPIANRDQSEIQGLIGFFANTLAIRTKVSSDLSFVELLLRIRDAALEAYIHQDLPFEKLVEELRPQRTLSHTPIFQLMFALQSAQPSNLELQGMALSSVEGESRTAKFDLTLFLSNTGNSLTQTLEYDTDLFDAETAIRIMGHFETLLTAAVKDTDQHISTLPLLTEAEQQQLRRWNETATEYNREQCIHRFVEEHAHNRPWAVAVVCEQERITYGELDRRANQLANYLIGEGAAPETVIGVCIEESADMVVGLLGVLKTGAAYLTLDPGYPRQRLHYMVTDANASILIAQRQYVPLLSDLDLRVVCIDSDWEEISVHTEEPPSCIVFSDDLAVVIYTSGSTGAPKGVCVSHRAISRLVCNTNYIQLSSEDRVMQASDTSFDATLFEIWGPLLHGGQTVITSKDVSLSPEDFAEHICRDKITTVFITTALFNEIARQAPSAFNSVRHVLFGGEAVEPKWVREVLSAGAPERLLHQYGPTESTTFSTWHMVREVEAKARTIPIGHPVSNTQAYILDGHLQALPVGIVGELYLGGDGLARVYLKQHDLTGETFVPNPRGDEESSRLYRTGDLARYLPDGSIEFLGRADQQVKLRGHRIELGEIEGVLREHPCVAQAVAVMRETDPGEKQLVAYVVAAPGSEQVISDLRTFLKRKLPDYMIPSVFVPMDQLPLTHSGKIDRLSLPAPSGVRHGLGVSFVPPRTPLEEEVANIWKDVLRLDRIGVHDNFFELGGHSLRATMAISRLRKAFQVELSVRAVFEFPTVAELTIAIVKNMLQQKSNKSLDHLFATKEEAFEKMN